MWVLLYTYPTDSMFADIWRVVSLFIAKRQPLPGWNVYLLQWYSPRHFQWVSFNCLKTHPFMVVLKDLYNIFDKHRPITSSCFPATCPPWKLTTSWKLMVGFSINFLLTWSLFGWHSLIPRGCVGRSTFHLTGQATHRVVQESSETHPPRIPAGIFLTGSFNLTSNLDFLRIGSLIGRESHCPLQREFKKKNRFLQNHWRQTLPPSLGFLCAWKAVCALFLRQ